MKIQVLLGAALVVMAGAANVANAKVPVVSGAKAISQTEKADVTGRCGCPGEMPTTPYTPPSTPPPSTPMPSKPGYGFGTTGHYGPPGQGFTPSNNWRSHAAGDGMTPTGRPLPPRAFK